LLREIGPGPFEVWLGERSFGKLLRRYQDVPAGAPLALIGGDGRIELAVNGGSAAQTYRIESGDRVQVRLFGRPAS
jgi:S-adenosylmethionine hydrolase